jgi:hypothetical protein
MNNFAAEFRDIFSLYAKLGEQLSEILKTSDGHASQSMVHSILHNSDSLAQISQMNSRIAKLCEDWNQCRLQLDPADREEADHMAAAAKAQALRLQELCHIHAQKLQTIHDELKHNLTEIGKGARYAKGLKSYRNNYPKFIDSSY